VRSKAKLPGSIVPAPRAARQSSEFAAKAIIAMAVSAAVCASVLKGRTLPRINGGGKLALDTRCGYDCANRY
jgi:hypothetical protein